MNIQLAKENEDGRAVYTIDMTPEETKAFVLLGIKTAILAGIEDDETVVDHICSDFMENWSVEYEKTMV